MSERERERGREEEGMRTVTRKATDGQSRVQQNCGKLDI